MSTARTRLAIESEPISPHDVKIVDWPLRDAAFRCLGVLVGSACLAAAAGWWAQSVAMGALVQVVFLLALWRLWVPVTYQLGRDGVVETTWRRWQHIDWLAVTNVQIHPRGVLLVADRTNTPLAAIGGIFIPWKNRRTEVLTVIEYYVATRIDVT